MMRWLVLFLFFTLPTFAQEGKFLLLLGPSGVGKSTIIHRLLAMDSRFVYISPYTTRDLRPGEVDKIHVTLETIEQMEQKGELLAVNKIYGIYYATPKRAIDEAIHQGRFPVLDWPVDKMDLVLKNYPTSCFTAYLSPESLVELKRRLMQDKRDKDGKRYLAGVEEFRKYSMGEFDKYIHMKVVNKQGDDAATAVRIYQALLQSANQ